MEIRMGIKPTKGEEFCEASFFRYKEAEQVNFGYLTYKDVEITKSYEHLKKGDKFLRAELNVELLHIAFFRQETGEPELVFTLEAE